MHASNDFKILRDDFGGYGLFYYGSPLKSGIYIRDNAVGLLADLPEDHNIQLSVFAASTRNKMEKLMLGPVRFVNHDCKKANVRYSSVFGFKGKDCVTLETISNIERGSEILAQYSESYFSELSPCQCSSCCLIDLSQEEIDFLNESFDENTGEKTTEGIEIENTGEKTTEGIEIENTGERTTEGIETENTGEEITEVIETEHTCENEQTIEEAIDEALNNIRVAANNEVPDTDNEGLTLLDISHNEVPYLYSFLEMPAVPEVPDYVLNASDHITDIPDLGDISEEPYIELGHFVYRKKIFRTEKQCVACKNVFLDLTQHWKKFHKFAPEVIKFLQDLYRTTKYRKRVFQCNTCCRRFFNKARHNIQNLNKCEIVRISKIADKMDFLNFPCNIRLLMTKDISKTAVKVSEAIQEYIHFQQYSFGREAVLSKGAQAFLKDLGVATLGFSQTEKVGKFLYQRKVEHKVLHVTVEKWTFLTKSFLEALSSKTRKTLRIDIHEWNNVLKTTRKQLMREAQRETFDRSEKRMKQVPDDRSVQELTAKVLSTLKEDRQCNFLSYKQSVAMNFFLIQATHNIRPGPILAMKLDEYVTLKNQNELIKTREHKTGYKYKIAIKIKEECHPFLDSMIEKYIDLYNKDPYYLFSNSSGNQISTIALWQSQVFQEFWPQTVSEFRFHATSMRKYWDSMWEKTGEVPKELEDAFATQTGHSKDTAKKYYVKGPTSEEMEGCLDFMWDKLVKNSYSENEIGQEMPSCSYDNAQIEGDGRGGDNDIYSEDGEDDGDSEDDKDSEDSEDDEDDEDFYSIPGSKKVVSQTKRRTKSLAQSKSKFKKMLDTYRAGKSPWTDSQKEVVRQFKEISSIPRKADVREKFLELFGEDYNEIDVDKVYRKIFCAAQKYL
jgi:hypothetical protein